MERARIQQPARCGWRLRIGLVTIGLLMSAWVGPAGAEKVAVLAIEMSFINLNPLTHTALNTRILNNILFDGLTRLEDESYLPRPDLAESWTVSPDKLEYIFRLRKGVVFHDGSPLTAGDVRYSLEVVCHRDNVRVADLYFRSYEQIRGCKEFHEGRTDRVEGIEEVDSHTLRVRLTEPNAAFLLSAAVTAVLPRAKYQDIPVKALPQHPLSRAPIGTGPFSFVEWREGDRLALKANPRYFLGKPKLDGLVIRFIQDPATRWIEFQNGGLHFAFLSPAPVDDFVAAGRDPRLVAKSYSGIWNRVLAVDHTNPLFKDVRVRQALGHAFDRKRILKEGWGDRGRISTGPFTPGQSAFNPQIRVPEYDPARARGLLADAGWRPGADGILRKEGRRFEFSLLNFPGPSKTMAIVYQDYLKRIGVDARLETVDFPTFWGVRFRPGKFEAASFHMPSGYSPDPSFSLLWFPCVNSRIGYCNREADSLMVKGRSSLDARTSREAYWKLQEVFARDLPVIWVVNPDDLRVASAKLALPNHRDEFLVMMGIRDWDLAE